METEKDGQQFGKRFSRTDPTISYRKYFDVATEDDNCAYDTITDGQFESIHVPDYQEVVNIYCRHNLTYKSGWELMQLINVSYGFIWDGLKKELESCSIEELHFFADKLNGLLPIKRQYEKQAWKLELRHYEQWRRLPTAEARWQNHDDKDGTEPLRYSKAMEYAAWLIGQAVTVVEKRLSFYKAPVKTRLPADPVHNSFEELFCVPEDIDYCVDALRRYRLEKPVLSMGLNWLGSHKDKTIIVAWIEAMEGLKVPKIYRLADRKQLVKLLNSYFSNLNMGTHARSFGNVVDRDAKDRLVSLIAH